MKKIVFLLFTALLVSAVAAGQEAGSTDTGMKKETKAAKLTRWHGRIVRSNKDASTLDVAKGNVQKTVVYDDTTAWTNKGKKADQSEFKDGSDVIVVGTYNDKGQLMAHRIELKQ
jgi:hypothetical protein